MKYAPKKVFVLENGTYLELSYAQFRQQEDTYQGRRFLSLHGMLMEVSEEAYKAFYKEQRRGYPGRHCSGYARAGRKKPSGGQAASDIDPADRR